MKLKVLAELGNFLLRERLSTLKKKFFNLEPSTVFSHRQKNKTMFPPKTNLCLKVTKSYMFRLTKLTIIRLNMKGKKIDFKSSQSVCFASSMCVCVYMEVRSILGTVQLFILFLFSLMMATLAGRNM